MAKIVAEQIVQLMLDARIERIYGVVGDALNPLTDARRRIRSWSSGSARGTATSPRPLPKRRR